MRISSVDIKKSINGLSSFSMSNLGKVVILMGENGSGKTRLLKLIEKVANSKREGIVDSNVPFCNLVFIDENKEPVEDISRISLINYSHSDLPLQNSKGFPPYVIEQSSSNLKKEKISFRQTAYDALLYLTYLTKYADKEGTELKEFNEKYCEPLLGGTIVKDPQTCEPLFGNCLLSDLDKKPLSPGQKYLLRICVALSCNIIPEGSILFLDEPESHLHPRALLKFIEMLTTNFNLGQIWIATHSIELASDRDYSEIWYMDSGKAKHVGSKIERVLVGILGEEKRYGLYQFVSSPDAYACHKFAIECLCNPEIIQSVTPTDASTGLIWSQLQQNDIIVDYGAGKGRFIQSYYMQTTVPDIMYYAYDKFGYSTFENDGRCIAEHCKDIMREYNISVENYFGSEDDYERLANKVNADKVLLINVLHEIAPCQWVDTFKKVERLLNEEGVVIIVEREELTIGEKPFDSDYFVLQQESVCQLFSCDKDDFFCTHHEKSQKVVIYMISKALIGNVCQDTVNRAIYSLKKIALHKISDIKKNSKASSLADAGLSLAFWTHQFANASLYDYQDDVFQTN